MDYLGKYLIPDIVNIIKDYKEYDKKDVKKLLNDIDDHLFFLSSLIDLEKPIIYDTYDVYDENYKSYTECLIEVVDGGSVLFKLYRYSGRIRVECPFYKKLEDKFNNDNLYFENYDRNIYYLHIFLVSVFFGKRHLKKILKH